MSSFMEKMLAIAKPASLMEKRHDRAAVYAPDALGFLNADALSSLDKEDETGVYAMIQIAGEKKGWTHEKIADRQDAIKKMLSEEDVLSQDGTVDDPTLPNPLPAKKSTATQSTSTKPKKKGEFKMGTSWNAKVNTKFEVMFGLLFEILSRDVEAGTRDASVLDFAKMASLADARLRQDDGAGLGAFVGMMNARYSNEFRNRDQFTKDQAAATLKIALLFGQKK